jgi:ABC-type transport system substrate-binding protein
MPNYWESALARRLGRRRMLAATAGSGASAALLAACGSGSSGSGKPSEEGNSLVGKQEDTTATAKRGGTHKISANSDVRSFEPYIRDISVTAHVLRTYQTLVRNKPTPFAPAAYDSLEGEAAESWEYSPDKLTLTFKLQPNSKFDPRAPTNGRVMDSQDVVYSWGRFAEVSTVRADLVNALNPAAPIASVAAPDARTFVMKLAR